MPKMDRDVLRHSNALTNCMSTIDAKTSVESSESSGPPAGSGLPGMPAEVQGGARGEKRERERCLQRSEKAKGASEDASVERSFLTTARRAGHRRRFGRLSSESHRGQETHSEVQG